MTSRNASQTACVSESLVLGRASSRPIHPAFLFGLNWTGWKLSHYGCTTLRIIIADQMREHFGVGVGFELVPGTDQFLFERVVIFNDAVMDDGDFAGSIEVRMAVSVGRNAVRGPARVADAEAAGGRFGFQNAGEALVNPALFLAQRESIAVQHRHAGAVIAAIFQPPQSFEQDGRGRFFSDVSNDAAHNFVNC